jgi:hypothetical protein
MTLIDGATAEVAARVDVGRPSSSLVATQEGPVGYAVDGGRGTVVRIDPRTFGTGLPVRALGRSSGHVTADATDDRLYLVDEDQGRVVSVDARHPDRGRREESLAEHVGSSAVDDAGRLWVLGASSGDLVWFGDGHRRRREGAVDGPAAAELVTIDGGAAVVDRAHRRVRPIDGSGRLGGGACVDMDPGDDTVRFSGSPGARLLYAVSGAQGVLRVTDLGSGRCSDVAVPVVGSGHDLGAPVESGGRVFVPE